MALEPVTAEAPVISVIPTTAEETAEIATQLSAAGSAITGYNVNPLVEVNPLVSSYKWNLSNDWNVNWRTAGGHPATGHLPSMSERDITTVWTAPA